MAGSNPVWPAGKPDSDKSAGERCPPGEIPPSRLMPRFRRRQHCCFRRSEQSHRFDCCRKAGKLQGTKSSEPLSEVKAYASLPMALAIYYPFFKFTETIFSFAVCKLAYTSFILLHDFFIISCDLESMYLLSIICKLYLFIFKISRILFLMYLFVLLSTRFSVVLMFCLFPSFLRFEVVFPHVFKCHLLCHNGTLIMTNASLRIFLNNPNKYVRNSFSICELTSKATWINPSNAEATFVQST